MPYKNLISEVLAAHADQLLQQQDKSRDYANLFPDNQDLPALLTLADQVKEALRPVQAPQSFKEQLQRDLIAAAHLKQLQQESGNAAAWVPQSPLLISAGLGALIALGSLFLLRRRQQQLQHKAI